MSQAKKPRGLARPVRPAAPWFALPSMTQAIGLYLAVRSLGADIDEPVLGVEIERDAEGTYPALEHWALSLLSPIPHERRMIREAVRRMVSAGLVVPVEGGIRILYTPEAYASHRRAP